MNYKEIADLLEKVADENGFSYSDMNKALDVRFIEKYEQAIISKVNENKKYEGRYFQLPNMADVMFPDVALNCKVISGRTVDQWSVSCLCYYETPLYWFDYVSHKIHRAGDYFFGHFEFEGFFINELTMQELDSAKEITKEEYESGARKHLEEILKLNWYPDHYRYGKTTPMDERWYTK